MKPVQDILSTIIANKREEINFQKRFVSLEQLQNSLTDVHPQRSMKHALSQSESGIIAEFKRKSPSKSWINKDAAVEEVIPAYTRAGASAISVLTDETFFGGTLKDLRTARSLTNIPLLRKDFTIDEYQLYQAKIAGADAILLIAAALSTEQCRQLAGKAHELKLEVLLEIHSEKELAYITPEIDMVGVNNRNLGTFHTSIENSFLLAAQLPQETLLVSESGLSDPATVKKLREQGFRGFLIGETFMKEESQEEALKTFITQINN